MNYLSQQQDPTTGKPIIDPKSLQAYQQHSQRERAYLAGGITAGMSLVPALQHYALANQRVPYSVSGQTYNIAPSQAAQLQTQQSDKEPKVPTNVGGTTLNLTPGQAATSIQEQQRIDLAKQPKGLTPYQQFEQQQALSKDQQDKIKNSPEFKFQQQYQVMPHQVLQPGVVDPAQQAYNLVDTSTGQPTQIQPDYNQYGVPSVPSWLASKQKAGQAPSYYWQNAGDIFRQKEVQSNVGGAKQTNYYTDPNGELVNIGGQRIPFSEIQGISNRHTAVLSQAKAAIAGGKDPKAVAQFYQGLGYDPSELAQ